MTLTLTVVDGGADPNDYRASFQFSVLDENRQLVDQRDGDLIPHLTAGQKTAIANFLDAMLTKAQGVVG